MKINRSMNIDKTNAISKVGISTKIATPSSLNKHSDKENSISKNFTKIDFLSYE